MFGKQDVLAALQRHIGAANGQRADFLVMEITGSAQRDPAGERRLRQLITELRLAGHHVCAHPNTGYFIAATDEELQQTCLFLHDRAMAGLKQVAAMRRVALPDLRGQLKLPT